MGKKYDIERVKTIAKRLNSPAEEGQVSQVYDADKGVILTFRVDADIQTDKLHYKFVSAVEPTLVYFDPQPALVPKRDVYGPPPVTLPESLG